MADQTNFSGSKQDNTKKIVLGFSGGLDTSFCVKFLTEDQGYEVHSIIVNTGGFTADELKQIETHAYKLGVKTHTTIDAVKGYYDRIIKYLVFGNVLKKQYLSFKCKCRAVDPGFIHS